MNATIEPGSIGGIIKAPPSKSMTQRAYAAALLHKGKTIIYHAGSSDDELAALHVIQQLGAKVLETDLPMLDSAAILSVTSNGVQPVSGSIACCESGLAARLFTPIAALSARAITIEGKGSLLQRPMTGVEEALQQLQVGLQGFNGHIPYTVTGPIVPSNIKINAADGSQLLSGLLFALCNAATQPITIEVTGLTSRPYIDMTLDVLNIFGKPVANDNYKTFHIDPAKFTHLEQREITVEGDWSGAAAMLVAGAIAGEVTVSNLNINSKQADVVILDVLRKARATVTVEGDSVKVARSNLRGFDFDATNCPDLFPVLSVLAACCGGESNITGVHRLFHKESNRAESISEMLMSFDVPYSIEDDVLCITGVRKLQGTVIDSFHDHRIVMAAAIGALRAGSRVDILNADAVNKSYPAFFTSLALCGGSCKLA
jgi:3-phosphoshikimate 1-carboxyvinyltransferase